jgi:hypothetical protein
MPENSQRDERELVISMDLAGPLIATRGVGSRKLVNVVERAYDLCQRVPESIYQVSVRYLKWSVALGGWHLADLRALALQVQDTAQGQDDIARLLAHRAMGFTSMIQGDLVTAQKEFESFLALYDPDLHANSVNFRFSSNNHLCSVLLALATTCTLRNLTDAADHWRDQALLHAQRSHNHISICQALVFCGGHVSGMLRRPKDMALYASEAQDYATKHQLPIWKPYTDLIMALSHLMQPVSALHASAYLEKAKECIDVLLTQHSAYLTTWVVFYASACLEHGRTQDGIDALMRIEERVNTGERWMEPEYLRLRARLQLAKTPGDTLPVQRMLREALALAHRQDAAIFIQDIQRDIQAIETSHSHPPEGPRT